MSSDTLIKLYRLVTGQCPQSVEELAKSGSARRYFRLGGVVTLIGTVGKNIAENNAFLYLASHFKKQGIAIPEVIAVSDDKSAYLQQDLGGQSLFDAIMCDRAAAWPIVVETIRTLPSIQFRGAEGLDWTKCYPQPEFDSRTVLWDLNYFKYCFLKTTGVEFDESALEVDFQQMALDLTGQNECFMYRDFQSRNVMIHNETPWFIDFQGGRRGPCHYDLASFLWQSRAGFTDVERNELIDVYLAVASNYTKIVKTEFCRTLDLFVLFRTMQVLGAYGYRGYFERKQHFIDSIPGALANLQSLLNRNIAAPYPYLNQILQQMTKAMTEEKTIEKLTVKVCSFSYKKGLPTDNSGNGGGYVFDCRAVHNPGRYDQYKQLSGLDKPVIDFLESNGEIAVFLDHCYALVDASVERYIERGF
ncbi:MAG: phosphotransferase, partial [Muribaculaceae bacterium]|nr:phosphotransferase [Muribaculaceae bacterium]